MLIDMRPQWAILSQPLILLAPRPPVLKSATTHKLQGNIQSPIPVLPEYVRGLPKDPGTPQQAVFLLIGLLVQSRARGSPAPDPEDSFPTF